MIFYCIRAWTCTYIQKGGISEGLIRIPGHTVRGKREGLVQAYYRHDANRGNSTYHQKDCFP